MLSVPRPAWSSTAPMVRGKPACDPTWSARVVVATTALCELYPLLSWFCTKPARGVRRSARGLCCLCCCRNQDDRFGVGIRLGIVVKARVGQETVCAAACKHRGSLALALECLAAAPALGIDFRTILVACNVLRLISLIV